MSPRSDYFVIGRRYTNRMGTYEVLDIGPEGMLIRYDDGKEQSISDLTVQERIVRNVKLEAEDITPYALQDARNAPYFRSLGFLAGRARFEAIVPQRAQEGFEEQYERVKGKRPLPGLNMYYVHSDPRTDKWGCELRISFEAEPEDMTGVDFGPEVNVVGGVTPNEHRINNNRFVWRLFEAEFSLGADQDVEAILTRIPAEYREDFNEGLAAAGSD